jgi:hypothetical protein
VPPTSGKNEPEREDVLTSKTVPDMDRPDPKLKSVAADELELEPLM